MPPTRRPRHRASAPEVSGTNARPRRAIARFPAVRRDRDGRLKAGVLPRWWTRRSRACRTSPHTQPARSPTSRRGRALVVAAGSAITRWPRVEGHRPRAESPRVSVNPRGVRTRRTVGEIPCKDRRHRRSRRQIRRGHRSFDTGDPAIRPGAGGATSPSPLSPWDPLTEEYIDPFSGRGDTRRLLRVVDVTTDAFARP